jgi:hypothetical protein
MKYPDELCQLVIRNMTIIEEAPSVVAEVQKILFTAINERIRQRVAKRGRDAWDGVYSLLTDERNSQTTFKPADWPRDEDDNYKAYYTLWCEDKSDLAYWLSHAIGLRNDPLSLRFIAIKELGEVTVKENKKRCQDFYTDTPTLQQAGFLYDKENNVIYLSFELDAETLATEYPDFDKALEPLDKALDALFSVHNVFDGFVKKLK